MSSSRRVFVAVVVVVVQWMDDARAEEPEAEPVVRTPAEAIRAAPLPEPVRVVAPAPVTSPSQPPPAEYDIIGAYGFQVMGQTRLINTSVSQPPPTVGVRQWFDEDGGFEVGLGLSVVGDDGSVDSVVGVMGGAMRTLGSYRNMTVFWEPQVGVWTIIPDNGDRAYAMNLRLGLGAEIRLGMIDLPRLGITTRIAGGLDLLHDGGSDLAVIGTGGSVNSGLRALFEGAFGFVFYM
jgi:hypothetical protein